jgi:ubiquitin-conjugating enzyme (huntingtin interacting protein 2)
MDTNRVSKELREIASDGASGVSVELVGDSLAHMRGTITGASRTNRDDDVFCSVFFSRVLV